jgi:mono/diheme cytochrome c family protein
VIGGVMASGGVSALDPRGESGKSAAVAPTSFKFSGLKHVFLWCVLAVAAPASAAEYAAVSKGAYLTAAAGCFACHTDIKAKGPPFAGGGPLKTPFGTFFAPNITPDPEHGIGGWSDADFERALRQGISPGGHHYFPVFPYTSYTNMTAEDARAIKAYLFSLTPIPRPSRAHDIQFPFGWRFAQTFWKILFFKPGPIPVKSDKPSDWNRGAYLVHALSHCAECHTPRNALGGLDRARWLAGAPKGAQGDATPNITPDQETGIGQWGDDEIVDYLKTGMDPDGDFAGSAMAEVIDHSTGKLSDEDLAAIAKYLRSVPAIRRKQSSPR